VFCLSFTSESECATALKQERRRQLLQTFVILHFQPLHLQRLKKDQLAYSRGDLMLPTLRSALMNIAIIQ